MKFVSLIFSLLAIASIAGAEPSYDWGSLILKLTQEKVMNSKANSLSLLESSAQLSRQDLLQFYFQSQVLVDEASGLGVDPVWSKKIRSLVLSDFKTVLNLLRASEGRAHGMREHILIGRTVEFPRLIRLLNMNRERLVHNLLVGQSAPLVNKSLASALALSRYISKASNNYTASQGAYRVEQNLKAFGVQSRRAQIVETHLHNIAGEMLYTESLLLMALEKLRSLPLNEDESMVVKASLEEFTEFVIQSQGSKDENSRIKQYVSSLSGLVIRLDSQAVLGDFASKFRKLSRILTVGCAETLAR